MIDSEAFDGHGVSLRPSWARQSPVKCEQVSRFVYRICTRPVFSPENVHAARFRGKVGRKVFHVSSPENVPYGR